MEWKAVVNFEKPILTDIDSSPTTVYLRKNIRKTEIDGKECWEYEEKQVPAAEYYKQQLTQLQQVTAQLLLSAAGGAK